MIKTVIAILFFSIASINAQQFNKNQLDSLYNLYTFLRGVNIYSIPQKLVEAESGL